MQLSDQLALQIEQKIKEMSDVNNVGKLARKITRKVSDNLCHFGIRHPIRRP